MGERPGKQLPKPLTSLIAFSISEAQTRHMSLHFAESQIRWMKKDLKPTVYLEACTSAVQLFWLGNRLLSEQRKIFRCTGISPTISAWEVGTDKGKL